MQIFTGKQRQKQIIYDILLFALKLLKIPEKGKAAFSTVLREGVKKKREKAVRLTAWIDPPRSGQENVKNSRQVVIFGVILPFYNDKMGQNFHKIEAVRLTSFFPFFFITSLTRRCQIKVQFESGAKKKFLESLFQPMTQILNYQSVPQTRSFQNMYNTYMWKMHLKGEKSR